MTSPPQRNVYTNPAFCQQSEFYNSPQQRCKSPPHQQARAASVHQRQPPLGALNPCQLQEKSQNYPVPGPKPKQLLYHEESYEEMLVDDSSCRANGNRYGPLAINENERVLIQTHRDERQIRYIQNDYNANGTNDNEDITMERSRNVQKNRYEYIPMQEQEQNGVRCVSPRRRQPPQDHEEEIEVAPGVTHRYEVIPQEQETQFVTTNKGRYALVPVEEVPVAVKSRYAVVSQQELQKTQQHRYEYIPEQLHVQKTQTASVQPNNTVTSPTTPRKGNPVATQKLYDLLQTPRKTPVQRSSSVPRTPQKMLSPGSPRRAISPIYPSQDSFQTPSKGTQGRQSRNTTPKAQQKLNYALSTRQEYDNKRHTAVIAPICSSPVQSVYSETTFSNKTESWMNLSLKAPVQASLAVASLMMTLCGALSAGLCFYMMTVLGRLYFLDFGVIAGFACFFLGAIGFRSRTCHWLPNRNYISGYVVLSIFSLLTCAALLLLLFMQPKPGSPWADVTSGAVCGISGLSLLLASSGVIASYCCKYPPPDNRVEHCARGFTV